MKTYSREDKKAFCRKYNQNRNNGLNVFDGFGKEDKLALALWQEEVLNRDSKIQRVRDDWKKWSDMAKQLIVELLQESEEKTTNKGLKRVLNINGIMFTLCKVCNGSTYNFQSKDNKCSCMQGYLINDKLKVISEDEYKKRATKKYFKQLAKARHLSLYNENELLSMDLNNFLISTGVRVL